MFDLSGKSALVTGASGGIGGAIARHLHGAGANVGYFPDPDKACCWESDKKRVDNDDVYLDRFVRASIM